MPDRDEIDELFGCDELDAELGNILKDIGKGLSKAGKAVVKVAKDVVDSDVFKVVFPVAALANSKPGLAIAEKLPGVGGMVSTGRDLAGKGEKLLDDLSKGKKPDYKDLVEIAKSVPGNEKLEAAIKSGSGDFSVEELKTLARGAISKGKGQPTSSGSGSGGFSTIFSGVDAALKKVGTDLAKQITTPQLEVLAGKPAAQPATIQQTVPQTAITVAPYGSSRVPSAVAMAPIAAEITTKLERKLGPQINAIADVLNRFSIQQQATETHNAIEARNIFRKKVIDSLKRISERV